MSMLVHRCTECGHGQHEHYESPQRCSFGACRCTRTRGAVIAESAPEEVPTFLRFGVESPSRLGPGDLIAHGSAGRLLMCTCDACVAAFSSGAA